MAPSCQAAVDRAMTQPGCSNDHGGCPSFNHNEHGCNADASCWYDHSTQMCHGHAAHAGCPSFNHNEHGCNADASCWYDHSTQMCHDHAAPMCDEGQVSRCKSEADTCRRHVMEQTGAGQERMDRYCSDHSCSAWYDCVRDHKDSCMHHPFMSESAKFVEAREALCKPHHEMAPSCQAAVDRAMTQSGCSNDHGGCPSFN